MKDNQTFSEGRRKALVALFDKWSGKVRDHVLEKFQEDHDRLRTSIIREFAEKQGCLRLTGQIAAMCANLDKATSELAAFGFEVDDDEGLTLSDSAPKVLRQSLEKRIAADIGTREHLERKMDNAVVKLLLVPTTDEANKLIAEFVKM